MLNIVRLHTHQGLTQSFDNLSPIFAVNLIEKGASPQGKLLRL